MADEASNLADFYDAELARHNAHLRVAAAIGRSDHVLDIGCGAGQTTRDAARAAGRGRAHGIDLSLPMLEIARQRKVYSSRCIRSGRVVCRLEKWEDDP